MEEHYVDIVEEIDIDEELAKARKDATSRWSGWWRLVFLLIVGGIAYHIGRFEGLYTGLLGYLILIVLEWSAIHRLMSLELIKEIRESRYALLRKMDGLGAEHPAIGLGD